MAEVTISRDGMKGPLQTITLDADGGFAIELPRDHLYWVSLTAVDHAERGTLVWARDDVHVEGRLGTYARSEPGETVGIHSEYIDANGKRVAAGPGMARRSSEARYTLELEDKPADAVALRYQLRGPNGQRTYNGPTADRFESDGGGDFWSVVSVRDRSTIALNLSQLPPSGRKSDLKWKGLDPTFEELQERRLHWLQQLDAIRDDGALDDGKATVARGREIADAALEALEQVDDPRTLGLLLAQHIGVFASHLPSGNEPSPLEPRVLSAIQAIDPTDPALAAVVGFDNHLYGVLRSADTDAVSVIEPWLLARARENPAPSAAWAALMLLLGRAEAKGDFDRAAELYTISERPQYEGTYEREFLAARYDPARKLRPGAQLPTYAFAGLTEKEDKVRSDDRDRLYLLEFWATWCGPCVKEQPKLHETYAAVNGLGESLSSEELRKLKAAKSPTVEFLFVSLDSSPDDVVKFRRESWPMPWTHGFVGREGEAALMEEFGFYSVPTAVLVNADGTIMATGAELRGEHLLPTLQRVLAQQSN